MKVEVAIAMRRPEQCHAEFDSTPGQRGVSHTFVNQVRETFQAANWTTSGVETVSSKFPVRCHALNRLKQRNCSRFLASWKQFPVSRALPPSTPRVPKGTAG